MTGHRWPKAEKNVSFLQHSYLKATLKGFLSMGLEGRHILFREKNVDGCALTDVTFYPNFTSLDLDDSLYDGKSQAGAFESMSFGVGSTVEFIEYIGKIGLGYAYTGIADP